MHPGAYKNFQESAQLRIGESRTVGAERFEVGEDLVHTHAQPTLRFAAATQRLEELREQWSGGVVVALQASRTAVQRHLDGAAGRRRRQADGQCPVRVIVVRIDGQAHAIAGGSRLPWRVDGMEDQRVAARVGEDAVFAAYRADTQSQRAARPLLAQRRHRLRPVPVVAAFPVIFIQLETVVGPGKDMHAKRARVADSARRELFTAAVGECHDGARTRKDGDFIEPTRQAVPRRAGVVLAAEEVVPVAVRQPDDLSAEARVRVTRGRKRRHDQLAAEGVLAGARVGGRRLRVQVVHWPEQGAAALMFPPGHAVEIGDEGVPQLHGRAGNREGLRIPAPGPALVEGILCAVQAQDRAEDAELQPARVQLGIFDAVHVATDVVAPPAKGDVGRRRRKMNLEGQRAPGDHGIAREADRVAMTAESAPARERE